MHNILHILKRDILRLVKVPAALVVVIALLVLPSAYTWYNVAAFWNPYGNTGNLRVCIASEDEGCETELTGFLNAGTLIQEAIEDNDQLCWVPTTREDAIERVKSGDCYAAFIIPQDFSQNLVSLLSGTFTQPMIDYYVNEKLGPVSPKITDSGANVLDATINSTFAAKVGSAIFDALNSASEDTNAQLTLSESKAQQAITAAMSAFSQAEASLTSLSEKTAAAKSKASDARARLENAREKLASLNAVLETTELDALAVQQDLEQLTPYMQSTVDELLEVLGDLADQGGLIGKAAQDAIKKVNTFSQTLFGTTLPAIGDALNTLSAMTGALSGTVGSQKIIINQLDTSLYQLEQTLDTTLAAVEQTTALLGSIQSDLGTISTDISALANSGVVSSLVEKLGLSTDDVVDFMGSPTEVVTEKLFSVNSYGAGMAPLFMNLTSWIGAFMIIVVMRQEVDEEKQKKLTIAQRYLGRLLLFGAISALQGFVCAIGVLALGVQTANPFALMLASVVTSITYMAVIFALSTTMQHIGKGICFFLVFLQIPGATGLYPLELLPNFFQIVYRFLPFTYGIDAMREAIAGFYGTQYLQTIGMLLLFMVVSTLLGILLLPLLANSNRMFAEKVKETGILVGEDIEVPEQTFKLSQIVRAVLNKEDLRNEIAQKYVRISILQPRIARWSVIIGAALSAVLILCLALSASAKIGLLTAWLVVLLGLAIVFIATETTRSTVERQLRIDELEDKDLLELYEARRSVSPSKLLFAKQKADESDE